jgi:hypothetical protein
MKGGKPAILPDDTVPCIDERLGMGGRLIASQRNKLDDKACRLHIAACLKAGKAGYKNDSARLYLRAGPDGNASWVLRYQRAGKSREMGLGGYDAVSLAQAREKAAAASRRLADGVDPIDARRQERDRLHYTGSATRSFRYCAWEVVKEGESRWRDGKYHKDWWNSMENHVHPVIGDKPVSEIDPKDALAVVMTPYLKAHPTLQRNLSGRIDETLRWAVAHGYRAPGRGLLVRS